MGQNEMTNVPGRTPAEQPPERKRRHRSDEDAASGSHGGDRALSIPYCFLGLGRPWLFGEEAENRSMLESPGAGGSEKVFF